MANYGVLMKLLATKSLSFGDGMINLKNVDFTLIPTKAVALDTKQHYLTDTMHVLYMKSWMWGLSFCHQTAKDFKLATPAKVYRFGMDLIEACGIGLYGTCEYLPGRYTHFNVKSPYIKDLQTLNANQPLDYFISGLMGGGGCMAHDKLMNNVELKCVAAGDKVCDFITGTEEELRKREKDGVSLWDIGRKRYLLDEILPLQKTYYEAVLNDNPEDVEDQIIKKLVKVKNDKPI